MMAFLWIGTLAGAILGVLHSILVFRQQMACANGSYGNALYFAVWSLTLWIVFGAYVLFFYLLGGAVMLCAGLIPGRKPR